MSVLLSNMFLDYLFHQKPCLLIDSIRVPLTVVFALHPPIAGCTVFSNPMPFRFMKGLDRLYPYDMDAIPSWDQNPVRTRLMDPRFEQVASCSLLHLSLKLAFLVAITFMSRVTELQVLVSDPSYSFYEDNGILLHPEFLTKVVWNSTSIKSLT